MLGFVKSNDDGAFTQLYQRYWKRLLVKANYLLRSNEDAEDVIHELFVALWKRREQLQIEHTFQTYIGASLKYLCLKKVAERKTISISSPNFFPSGQRDDSTQEWLAFHQLQNQLSSAIDDLPEKCRIIFRMSREQGFTDKEIAGKLRISTATVRTQKHRALSRLRVTLNQFLGFFTF